MIVILGESVVEELLYTYCLHSSLGESLSKKELEANNRIKKLRMKLKEVTGEKESHR